MANDKATEPGGTVEWNGWSIDISEDGNEVFGSKDSPHGDTLVELSPGNVKASPVLTVKTTSATDTAWEIGLLGACAAMADEDVRVGLRDSADYWHAYHRLYRQYQKNAVRGEELVAEELVARDTYRATIKADKDSAGDAAPVSFPVYWEQEE